MSKILPNPDCRDGKHQSCSGTGWDVENDMPAPCPCNCHHEFQQGVGNAQVSTLVSEPLSRRIGLDIAWG